MPGKILLRGSLSDTGQVPHRTLYSSPDIITHDQVKDSSDYFKQNYNSDPNQTVETLNNNFIYVRVKNIGNADTEENYVHLFSHVTSLYVNPNNCESSRISTIRGNRYSTLAPIKKGEIAATSDYFLFNGTQKYGTNCCFACVVSTEKKPDFTYIRSWEQYCNWIYNNPNIATRNMVRTLSYRKRQFEDLYNISNPYTGSVHVIYQIEAHNLVEGTVYGIESVTVDSRKAEKKFSSDEDSHSIQTIGTMEQGFDDFVRIYGILPNEGQSWPDDAYFTVTSRIAYADNQLPRLSDKVPLTQFRTTAFHNPVPRLLESKCANNIIIGIPIGMCCHSFH